MRWLARLLTELAWAIDNEPWKLKHYECLKCGNWGPLIDEPGGGPRYVFRTNKETGLVRCQGESLDGHGLCWSEHVAEVP